jgi:hypothetical protein
MRAWSRRCSVAMQSRAHSANGRSLIYTNKY